MGRQLVTGRSALDERITFKEFFFLPQAPKLALALTPFWSDQDFFDINGWVAKIDCDVEPLLKVLVSESGLRPDAQNPRVGPPIGVGLNQMTRIAFQSMGLLPADETKAKAEFVKLARDVLRMSVREQFEKVIIPFFIDTDKKYKGKPWTAVRLYMANAGAPLLGYGQDPKTVIYPKGSASYELNKQLDTNGDGQITIGDLITAVDYHESTPEYAAAVYRYRKVNNLYPFKNPSLPG